MKNCVLKLSCLLIRFYICSTAPELPFMKLLIISMGRGKMMVLFFSAEMLVSVCRYLDRENGG